jgi:L-lactate dehydrogenase complex protein LldF
VKEGHTPAAKTIAMKTMATVLANPTIFNLAGKSGRFVMKNIPALVNNKMNKWYDQREMPAVPEESFREWYKKNSRESKAKKDE